MTTPSLYESTGLSINVADPIYQADDRADYGDIAEFVSSYAHIIDAEFGFLSASFTIKGPLEELESWIDGGLGRDIEVSDGQLGTVWRGFVNSIALEAGSFGTQVGPMTDVANQIVVLFTPIDAVADPPVRGPQSETTAATDSKSQTDYGIWEQVYTGGEVLAGSTPPLEEQIRDTRLSDAKDPPRTQRGSIGQSSGEATLTVECLGYWAWLMAYIFNDTTASTTTISARIQDILAADPNGIFSTNYSYIETNAALVNAYDRDNAKAIDRLRGLTASGDGTNNVRWALQFYEDQVARYSGRPTSIYYEHRITDPSQRITTVAGAEVMPWQVRPWRWLKVTDYLIGRAESTADLATDPRNILIESVQFTAPYQVDINGARLEDLPQLIGQLGLSGMA